MTGSTRPEITPDGVLTIPGKPDFQLNIERICEVLCSSFMPERNLAYVSEEIRAYGRSTLVVAIQSILTYHDYERLCGPDGWRARMSPEQATARFEAVRERMLEVFPDMVGQD